MDIAENKGIIGFALGLVLVCVMGANGISAYTAANPEATTTYTTSHIDGIAGQPLQQDLGN